MVWFGRFGNVHKELLLWFGLVLIDYCVRCAPFMIVCSLLDSYVSVNEHVSFKFCVLKKVRLFLPGEEGSPTCS